MTSAGPTPCDPQSVVSNYSSQRPLANIFPMMLEEELNDLGDDMLAHGQREPIWSYESKILDGRNRYRACLLKGIEPRIVEYLGMDPLGFVISMNLKRRHLDASQRAMVAADIANLPKGSHPPIGGSSATQQVASKLLNVSVRSAQRARYVKDHGVPGLVRAVEQGDVKVAAAAEFTKTISPQDQARLIDEYQPQRWPRCGCVRQNLSGGAGRARQCRDTADTPAVSGDHRA